MFRLQRFLLIPVAFAVFCLGSATAARADTITLNFVDSGYYDLFGGHIAASQSYLAARTFEGPASNTVMGGQGADLRATTGEWSSVKQSPHSAIHTHLLPTGKVFFYPSGDYPTLWNPITDATTPAQNAGYNIFCTGHSFMPDGRLFLAGGHVQDYWGLPRASAYDPFGNSWATLPNMNAGRWYPTAIALADGDMLVIAGQIDNATGMNPLPQVWERAKNRWRNLTGAQLILPFYPYMFVAPNGRVFCAGPERITRYLNTSGNGSWSLVAYSNFGGRNWGTAVMYEPGKVLIVGGTPTGFYDGPPAPPTASAEVINLNAATPAWQYVAQMSVPRKHHNATLLPDGKVLVTGGSSGDEHTNQNSLNPAYAAEAWDPATNTWTTLASNSVYRGYHSTALLLPDGRVLTAGGDWGGASYEVFSPPYLFKGSRPTITSAPTSVGYGKQFSVQTPDAASITKMAWLRLSSVTHSFNMGQRINFLTFSRTTGSLNVTTPANRNLCPPGNYMLFILNDKGVPSEARIIRIQ